MQKYRIFTIGIILLCSAIYGCSGLQVQDEDQEQIKLVAVRMASRAIAEKMADEGYFTDRTAAYLEEANRMIAMARAGQLEVVPIFKAYAMSFISDPYLRMDISDLLDLMDIDEELVNNVNLNEEEARAYLRRVEYALEGFIQGMEKSLDNSAWIYYYLAQLNLE